ncbi:MAG: hypothetical protein IT319_05530 [Anaerolineae bacterium]|nr:hypothetical protein [Anaerolineae bacterium]
MKALIAPAFAPVVALLVALSVTGFVHDGAAEVIFPQAIRFTLDIEVPTAEVDLTELTLTWDDHDPVVITVDAVQAGRDTETGAVLEYVWRIPVDDPPPLFADIGYRWTLTAADGSTGTLDDTLTFRDPRVEWVRLDAGDFHVAAPRAQSVLVESLRQVGGLLEQNTGRSLAANLLIYPFDPGCTPGENPDERIARAPSGFIVTCDAGITDAVLAGYQLLLLESGAAAESLVVETLVRDAYAPLWRGGAVPDWFADGLAQFYAPAPKNALLPVVRQASRDRTLLPLDDMQTEQPATLWHAQSLGMILYIADRIGFQGLFDLARGAADDFESAYADALGEPLSALLPAWQQWLFTRAAESVYGMTPYQPPTPTPTFTPTASGTPTATPTPTASATATPTITPTLRGVRTVTPPPTRRPSDTPTAPPPTVTPRPPGSLPTVTPPPTVLEVVVSQPGVQAGAGVFLLLLLGLLLFLYIRLGNRR